jgi:hypothetical protein
VICLSEGALIKCPDCSTKFHLDCFQKHILSGENSCPTCSNEWTVIFLVDILPQEWLDGSYRTYRLEKFLADQEALLPATQADADACTAKQELMEQLEAHRRRATSHHETQSIELTIDELRTNFWEKTTPRIEIIQRCPIQECKGPMIEGKKQCSICKSNFCYRCEEKMIEDHKCEETVVESLKLIKKEAKSCPKCQSPITRISGCDDMFCTHCNTAFNWTSMIIQARGNSNPHYWDWKRTQGKADVIEETDEIVRRIVDVDCEQKRQICQQLRHIYLYVVDSRVRRNQEDLRRIRIQYLMKQYNYEQWKSQTLKMFEFASARQAGRKILIKFVQHCLEILEVSSDWQNHIDAGVHAFNKEIRTCRKIYRLLNFEVTASLDVSYF